MLRKLINRLRTSKRKVQPSVYVEVTDVSESVGLFPGIFSIVPEKGPVNEPIYIGPTISKPRWWQFWRWHLIKQYRRECQEAQQKFMIILLIIDAIIL